ncbi:hypothetical protein, partial [Enterococcus faecium]|uniref:hypothetical protein n=1 Tax=Enterococcus faecium TaxID=1352 RepID=UPI000BD48C3A
GIAIGEDGIRVKNGKKAQLTLWYASGDSTRRDLAQAVSAMVKPLGIAIGEDGIRVKNGKKAQLTLWYASGDSTRRD